MESPFPPRCRSLFTPERRLAAGGYGEVWLARQQGLDREVAVKVLSGEGLTRPDDVERFRAEAHVTARLTHPAIVVVHDHDVEDGVPWIAYELLPGPSLGERLGREGRLPPATAVEIARQVAGALETAHAAGVVHRDVKPDNVLFAGPERVKLTDFGIAKLVGNRVKTQTGIVLGTPSYIAPETIAGDPPGPASDLYSLGAMLHEMIAGEPPYGGESVVKVLEAHIMDPIPDLAKLDPQVPRAVAAVVRAMLAKRPADRPASATAVRETLARLIADGAAGSNVAGAGSPHPSAPPKRGLTLPPRSEALAPEPRTARAPLAVVLALAIGLGALALRRAGPVEPPVLPPASGSGGAGERTPLERESDLLEERLGVSTNDAEKRTLEKVALAFCLKYARSREERPKRLADRIGKRAVEGMQRTLQLVQKPVVQRIENVEIDPSEERRLFSHLIGDLAGIGPLMMSPRVSVEAQGRFLKLLRLIVDNDFTSVLDPGQKLPRLIESWEAGARRSFIPALLMAVRASKRVDVLRELPLRERALERFTAEHLAGPGIEPGAYAIWAGMLAELKAFFQFHRSVRGVLGTLNRYAQARRALRWRTDPSELEDQAAAERLLLAQVPEELQRFLTDPGLALPDWNEDGQSAQGLLDLQLGARPDDYRLAALRWCLVMKLSARPLPRELPPKLVERAAEHLVGRVSRMRELAGTTDLTPAGMTAATATGREIMALVEEFWPVVLDRPAQPNHSGELAMTLHWVLAGELLAMMDPADHAGLFVRRWQARWPGSWEIAWVADGIAERRKGRDPAVRVARMMEIAAMFEKKWAPDSAAGPTISAVKYWALLQEEIALSLGYAGKLPAAHELERRFAAHVKRVAGRPEAAPFLPVLREKLKRVRDALTIMSLQASPRPSPLPGDRATPILGASDDPTPRRDRPGQ